MKIHLALCNSDRWENNRALCAQPGRGARGGSRGSHCPPGGRSASLVRAQRPWQSPTALGVWEQGDTQPPGCRHVSHLSPVLPAVGLGVCIYWHPRACCRAGGWQRGRGREVKPRKVSPCRGALVAWGKPSFFLEHPCSQLSASGIQRLPSQRSSYPSLRPKPLCSSGGWAGTPRLCSPPPVWVLSPCHLGDLAASSTSQHPHLQTGPPPQPQLGHPRIKPSPGGDGAESCSCQEADIKFKDVLDGSLGIRLYFYSLYINATKV